MARGDTRYTPNGGILPLREAIVAKLARENGLDVDVEQVWVTVGATQALHMAMALTLSQGDEVLLPDPGYTTFTMNAHLLQAVPVPYPLRPERGFQPDLAELEALVTERTRVLIVNSPSNPLGSTFDRETLTALMDLARRHDLWVISDEVYERFTWGAPHVSPATLDRGRTRPDGVLDLEDLRHDRRSRRMARHAARVAADDAPRPGGARELRRRAVAAGRGRRDHRPAGWGRARGRALPRQPRRRDGAARPAGDPLPPADRRVLSLDRRLARLERRRRRRGASDSSTKPASPWRREPRSARRARAGSACASRAIASPSSRDCGGCRRRA